MFSTVHRTTCWDCEGVHVLCVAILCLSQLHLPARTFLTVQWNEMVIDVVPGEPLVSASGLGMSMYGQQVELLYLPHQGML